MLQFLKSFLSEEEISKVEAAYKAKNPDSKGLPTYIPQYRFTEKENEITQLKSTHAQALAAETAKYKDYMAPDAVATLKQELEAQKKATTDAQSAIAIVEKIYALKPRSVDTVKAVRALMDPTKPVDDELKRIAEANPHFFGEDKKPSGVPKGTGKTGEGDEGSKDGNKNGVPDANALRRAMGLPLQK